MRRLIPFFTVAAWDLRDYLAIRLNDGDRIGRSAAAVIAVLLDD